MWTWTTFEFHSKSNSFVQNIAFAKHDMQFACFGTSVGKCALPIERICFLKQACRCFMLWCSEACVSIFSWMWNRRARNGYCPAFVSWPSTCDCLHLLIMLDSSGWCHSFVHISIQWAQRGGRGSPTEWGWSECCRKGNLWWMERPWLREMHVRVLEMKCRMWECHWQWQTALSQWSMDEADEVSFAWVCTSMHRG